MTTKKEFQPGQGYTKEDWDAVSDNPEWTAKDIANAKPFAEVFPHLAESIKRSRGRPAKANPLEAVTLRVPPDLVARFKAQGRNWRAKMVEALQRAS